MGQADQRLPRIAGVSRNVFFLGVVSFLTDVSSDMIFTLLPLFLTNVLGVGTAIIGLIEGIGESTATLLKIVSGWLSDWWGKRKLPATLGYTLSTAAKPFLYLASAWGVVLAVRFADRAGKGIRTSPRDALIADSTTPEERGRSFGLHRAMDSYGAVVGLALAAVIVFLVQRGGLDLARSTFQTLVLVGVIPAVMAVLVIFFLVQEPRRGSAPAKENSGKRLSLNFGTFDARFKIFLAIMVLFTLGNSSDVFLVLRAHSLDLSVFHILVLLVLFNLVYATVSTPAGVLSDKFGRKVVITVGWLVYAATYLGLALATAWWHLWVLFALYGLYYGAADGVARAYVADVVAVEKRGTAYGLYHGAVGLTLLPASLIAGFLWQAFSPAAPFFFGAGIAALAALLLATLLKGPARA